MVSINPVCAALDLSASDRIIAVKESGTADANFVLTYFVKKILSESNKICIVLLHNALGHYCNIGKRLGYDFAKSVNERCIIPIEPIKEISDDIGGNTAHYLKADKEEILRSLFLTIDSSIKALLPDSGHVYLIIEDLSHLLDLGIHTKYIIAFTSYCLSLINNPKISLVINTHVSSTRDEIIFNNLSYAADVLIDVAPLKTGVSRDVTGVINVAKKNSDVKKQFQYKAFDKGIKIFHSGESIYNLYR